MSDPTNHTDRSVLRTMSASLAVLAERSLAARTELEKLEERIEKRLERLEAKAATAGSVNGSIGALVVTGLAWIAEKYFG